MRIGLLVVSFDGLRQAGLFDACHDPRMNIVQNALRRKKSPRISMCSVEYAVVTRVWIELALHRQTSDSGRERDTAGLYLFMGTDRCIYFFISFLFLFISRSVFCCVD